MYFKDLTPYEYYLPFKFANVLNVGWLDKDVDFAKGDTPSGLVEKLYKILINEGVCKSRVNQIRGVHPCIFCNAHVFRSPFIGSCELWIPSHDSGVYFAAPSLLIHYIQEHRYCPPKTFADSVRQLNLEKNFNGQELYQDLIKVHSGGK